MDCNNKPSQASGLQHNATSMVGRGWGYLEVGAANTSGNLFEKMFLNLLELAGFDDV